MKTVIVIGGESQHGPEAMANTLCICDCILKDKSDGDEISATIKGTLIDHGDGKRYIAVSEVDGEPVEEMDDNETNPSQEETDKSIDENHSMGAVDALDNYMQQKE